MTRRLALGTVLSLFVTVLALAQPGLTGSWEGETPNGARIVLTLKAEKGALTGTLKRNDDSTPISDGKVTKNTFTFKANMNETPETLSGEWTGDEMKVWLERQGAERAIVLRRAKPQGK
jgi:hypothetical protein